jgi:general nucleoside transport system permease protein
MKSAGYGSRAVVSVLADVLPPLLAVVGALGLGAILILAIGESPLASYRAMLVGAFGDRSAWADTLEKATPYLFGGLSFLVASKAGLFNIGIEGQMYAGAMAAAMAGFLVRGVPAIVHLPLALAAAALAGALFAYLPAALKFGRNVHEVVSTTMLNYIAYAGTAYLTVHLFADPGAVAQTRRIEPSAALPLLAPPSKVNLGIFIALALALALWLYLFRTPGGFRLRVTGLSGTAASYAGINVRRVGVLAMAASGAVGGLMGAERALGVYGRYIHSFSPGYGFTSIAVALLASNHPLGVIPAAILFGALENGGSAMSLMVNVPRELGLILEAFIIVFIAADKVLRRRFGALAPGGGR